MAIVLMCRKMHWTYQDYRSQPLWFTDILAMVERLDGEKSQKEQAELERQAAEAKRKANRR